MRSPGISVVKAETYSMMRENENAMEAVSAVVEKLETIIPSHKELLRDIDGKLGDFINMENKADLVGSIKELSGAGVAGWAQARCRKQQS